jgi:drug/metabolite transporter (DMT)-like permease
MPLWFVFGLLSIGAMAGSEISQKISMTNKKDISAITNNFFVWTLQGTLGVILAFILGRFSIPIDGAIYLKLVLIGILYFIGGTFFYTSYKANSASLSIILGTVSVLASTTLGILLLGEGANLVKFFGIISILFAIFIVNYTKGATLSKYNYYALIGGIAWGVAFTVDKSFIMSSIYPMMYVGLMGLSVAFVSFLIGHRTIIKEAKGLAIKDFYPMVSSSIFGVLFNAFTLFAYFYGGDVGKLDAMNNSMVFIVILFEILVFKDSKDLKKKILAAIIAFIGIWSLTL